MFKKRIALTLLTAFSALSVSSCQDIFEQVYVKFITNNLADNQNPVSYLLYDGLSYINYNCSFYALKGTTPNIEASVKTDYQKTYKFVNWQVLGFDEKYVDITKDILDQTMDNLFLSFNKEEINYYFGDYIDETAGKTEDNPIVFRAFFRKK